MMGAGESRPSTQTYEDFSSGFSQYFSAIAGGAWDDMPTRSAQRLLELQEAQSDTPEEFAPLRSVMGMDARGTDALSQVIEPEEAKQRIKDSGFKIEYGNEPIREQALDLMIERARKRAERESVIDRARLGGFSRFSLEAGTSLAVGLFDPLNVASMFIPIAPTRYAAALERAASAGGRAGVRAGFGALEGVVGTAALEPLTYFANTQEGQDYTMANALSALAIGGILGGGLHVAGGAIADRLSFRRAYDMPGRTPEQVADLLPPESRMDLMRVAAADLADGRPPRVEEALAVGARADSRIMEAIDPLRDSPARAVEFDRSTIEEVAQSIEAFRRPEQPSEAQSLFTYVAKQGGIDPDSALAPQIREAIGDRQPQPGFWRRGGKNAEDMVQAAVEGGYLRPRGDNYHADFEEFTGLLGAEARGSKQFPESVREGMRRAEAARSDMDEMLNYAGVTDKMKPEEAAVRLLEWQRDYRASQDAYLKDREADARASAHEEFDDPAEAEASARAAKAKPSDSLIAGSKAETAATQELQIAKDRLRAYQNVGLIDEATAARLEREQAEIDEMFAADAKLYEQMWVCAA